jgi:CRISPR-associated exonuclease Cas4
MPFIVIAIPLLLAALVLWGISARLQKQTGLPRGRVVYDDASGTRVEPPPLVDHQWGLAGRPDYLLEQKGIYIPVEVKPTRRATTPYASDVMQLATYCRLVEAHYGIRPTHGILRYATQTFEIAYTPALAAQLEETLRLMAAAEKAGDAPRHHNEKGRCRACSQRAHCNQSLV